VIRSRTARRCLLLAVVVGAPVLAVADEDPRRLLKSAIEDMEAGDYVGALETLQLARELDPGNPDVLYYLGRNLFHAGDHGAATEVLAAARELSPRSFRVSLLLARGRLVLGAPASADSLVDEVLALKPDDGEALFLKGLVRLAEGDTARALEAWERALSPLDWGTLE